ncbi:MAG: hypothetical protein ACJAVA_000267 [Flavobacteriaceae bacterium]|jgi:hypothetical protein
MAKYTQKEIDRDRKHYLREQIQNANELLKITQNTQICWEVSCDYERFDTNVLEVLKTEEECKEMLKDWAEDEETKDVELFYRPIVIDDDNGDTITFQNLHYYKKDSFFVKSLNKYLHS